MSESQSGNTSPVTYMLDAAVIVALLLSGLATIVDLYAAFVVHAFATTWLTTVTIWRASRHVRKRHPQRSFPPAGHLVDINAKNFDGMHVLTTGIYLAMWGGRALRAMADKALFRAALWSVPAMMVFLAGSSSISQANEDGLSGGLFLLVVRTLVLSFVEQRVTYRRLTTEQTIGKLHEQFAIAPGRHMMASALIVMLFSISLRFVPDTLVAPTAVVTVIAINVAGNYIRNFSTNSKFLELPLHATPGYYPDWLPDVLSGQRPAPDKIDRSNKEILAYWDGTQFTGNTPDLPPDSPTLTRPPETDMHGPPLPSNSSTAPPRDGLVASRVAYVLALLTIGPFMFSTGVIAIILMLGPTPPHTPAEIAVFDQPVTFEEFTQTSYETTKGPRQSFGNTTRVSYEVDGRQYATFGLPHRATLANLTVCVRSDAPEQFLAVAGPHTCGEGREISVEDAKMREASELVR